MNKRFVVMFGSKEKIYHEVRENTNFETHNFSGCLTCCNRVVTEMGQELVDRFYSYRPKNHRMCKVCTRVKK